MLKYLFTLCICTLHRGQQLEIRENKKKMYQFFQTVGRDSKVPNGPQTKSLLFAVPSFKEEGQRRIFFILVNGRGELLLNDVDLLISPEKPFRDEVTYNLSKRFGIPLLDPK